MARKLSKNVKIANNLTSKVDILPLQEAIDLANELLPTPGGPDRHKIGDFISSLNFLTAKNSKILSLIFSKP